MKTSQIFLALQLTLLLTACNKDETNLENETINLESLNQHRLILADNDENEFLYQDEIDNFYYDGGLFDDDVLFKNCVYLRTTTVYYKSAYPDYKSINLMFAMKRRENALSNIKFNGKNQYGCKKYIIPASPILKYDLIRRQYYEIWQSLGEPEKPSPNSHEIEI